MKVLIVYAHSQPASFNAAMLGAAKATLAAQGHEVRVSDLYQMGFNPVASASDFKERRFPDHMQYDREQKYAVEHKTFSDDIAAEIEKVLWCDLLILQFPLWWYSVPAIMKGWFDRVFVNGLMYGQLGRFNHGGLKGKRAMVSTTTGCFPGMVDEGGVMGHLDAVLWHLQYGTLAYVGFDVLDPYVAWSTRYSEDNMRQQYLEEFAEHLRNLDSRPSKDVHATEDFGKDWKLKPGIEPQTFGHQPFPLGRK
jgi:NAD(P)H dehydrogenase (quinone)